MLLIWGEIMMGEKWKKTWKATQQTCGLPQSISWSQMCALDLVTMPSAVKQSNSVRLETGNYVMLLMWRCCSVLTEAQLLRQHKQTPLAAALDTASCFHLCLLPGLSRAAWSSCSLVSSQLEGSLLVPMENKDQLEIFLFACMFVFIFWNKFEIL